MKTFFFYISKSKFQNKSSQRIESIVVYEIIDNRPYPRLNFKINTGSYPGYHTSVMRKLASEQHISPEFENQFFNSDMPFSIIHI